MILTTQQIEYLTNILVHKVRDLDSNFQLSTPVRLIQALALYDAGNRASLNLEDVKSLQEYVLYTRYFITHTHLNDVDTRIDLLRVLIQLEDNL
ncbi:hypothetical protein b3_0106 [Synechococcus phage B3]|nr:hypothetical protein b3_0106 [Synechococcus phage B3]QGT54720.1 hypothetical protein b23_0105 [Synechococcus phage B23]